MRILMFSVVCLLITSCASTPISPKKAEHVPDSRVYAFAHSGAKRTAAVQITRDVSHGIGGGCTIHVRVDGMHAADIHSGETVQLWVRPRRHVVSIGDDAPPFCSIGPVQHLIHAKNSAIIYLRISFGKKGRLGLTETLPP